MNGAGVTGMVVMTLALAACSGAAETQTRTVPSGDPDRGLQIMSEAGCGACHEVPGLDWPRGQVGPPLSGMGGRALIGSGLPNRPENLIPYLINAPAVDPGSAMPPMPITEEEARDVAAWLYEH
ncbi:MAG: sulfur-oxidizing protein SoxX [Brevundimonas sp.]|jgi:sulfur-oxidizing protein SoxX